MQAHILTKCWRVGWAQAYLEAGQSHQQDFVLGPLMISSYSQASPHLRHSCRTSFSSSWPWQQVQPAVPALGDLFHIESSTSGGPWSDSEPVPRKNIAGGGEVSASRRALPTLECQFIELCFHKHPRVVNSTSHKVSVFLYTYL